MRKFYFEFVLLVETNPIKYRCSCVAEKMKFAQGIAIQKLKNMLKCKYLSINDVAILSLELIKVEKE